VSRDRVGSAGPGAATGPAAALAKLAVRFGANVQPGQIVAISSEPGKEPLARAIAESAYAAGARFVDLAVFDVYFKRARALHADPATLSFVPPWLGERAIALGRHRCARIHLTGPTPPDALEGIDPALLALDLLPGTVESSRLTDERTTNWTALPCPTPHWARMVHPELEPGAALERLWREVAHICRLDEPEPVASWQDRLQALARTADRLNELPLDAVRLHGPGTELRVGLMPSSSWSTTQLTTVDGILHSANIPTEEVFTTPDPARVSGTVAATMPLFTAGTVVRGLRIRFEDGRAVEINADSGAEVIRGLAGKDDGAARLGEIALVDRRSRIGPLGTVFFDTLIDENAASHIALGQGYEAQLLDPADLERINQSAIHVDFMVGSDSVSATGLTRDGAEIPLLRGGNWQI
jgi:aminopeptidase